MKYNLSFGQRLILPFLLMILGFVIVMAFNMLLQRLPIAPVAALRIGVVGQDLLMFIVPALVTALLVTRLAADFLHLRSFPGWRKLLLWIGGLIVLFPLIEGLDRAIQQLPWPQWALDLEASAEAATKALLGAPTVGNVIVNILLVGVLTGLSEELFFRGALQGVLESRPMNAHLAIWLTAIVFSLFHFQPVGFVQRTLLGAFMGYSVRSTGSLWTAVILHALNNSAALFFL